MALYPKVVEVSRDRATGETYVLVDFYPTRVAKLAGTGAVLREEFVMQLRPTYTISDSDGSVTATGPIDVRAEMLANIQDFIARAERNGWRGNLTQERAGRPRLRDSADTFGILTVLRSEVGK